jgi:hypothetical protein
MYLPSVSPMVLGSDLVEKLPEFRLRAKPEGFAQCPFVGTRRRPTPKFDTRQRGIKYAKVSFSVVALAQIYWGNHMLYLVHVYS